MADRTVKVSLILAAQGYMSGMDRVAQKTAQTGSEIEKLNQKRQAFTQLGASAMGFGAAAAAGVGLAISRFADFDQQMSFVQAATHETASNMNLLRNAALDAGARTVYSATEAAGAIEELAKAGVSTKDILSGGLDAALDLAAAGGLAVADAAGIAATALKTFNLQGEDMSHVADLLAAGAGKAMGDVSELAAALAQGGQVAKSTGLSIEETTAGLAAFAEQGLRGSDAGTSFKSMLQRLTPQSAEAQREMDRLGISAYDANGQFIGLANFAGVLQNALKDLTPEQRNAAMATIFGADAVRAANVLYENGATGIQEWTEKVNDQGYAAETARTRLDNLKGDVEALGGAFDTALIQSGSGANDALRSLVQTVTGAVGIFSDLPAPVQETALYLGLAAAAVGLVGGAALIATPRVAEFRAIVSAAGLSMKGLSLAAGGVTLGLTAVIAVIAAVSTAQAEARAKAQSYADTLEAGTQKITDSTRDMAIESLKAKDSFLWMQQDSAYDAAEKLGISLDLVTDAATGNADALAELQRQIDAGADGSLAYANSAVDIENAVRGEAASIAEAAEMARQKEKADRDSAAGSQTAAEAYLEAADGADELQSTLADLLGTINELNGIGQDAITTNASYQEALAAITTEVQRQKDAYVEANGTLDGFNLSLADNTVAGSANAAMLADVAGKAISAADAQFKVDQQTMSAKDAADKYAGTLAAQRQAFIDSALAAGYNADEVYQLADQVFRLPTQKEIDIIADTSQALRTIEDFKLRYGTIRGTIVYRATREGPAGDGAIGGYATGGRVRGPGTSTSDSVIARLSRDEHVWTAAEVAGAGGHEQVAAMRAAARSGTSAPEFSYGRAAANPAPAPLVISAGAAGAGAGDTYEFNGQFAMTAEEIARLIDKGKRRRVARSGSLRAAGVT
jgi:TP901 family phage tail tape measure protein